MVFHPSHRPLEIATRFPQFHSPDDDDISPTNKKHKGTLLSSYRGGHFYWATTHTILTLDLSGQMSQNGRRLTTVLLAPLGLRDVFAPAGVTTTCRSVRVYSFSARYPPLGPRTCSILPAVTRRLAALFTVDGVPPIFSIKSFALKARETSAFRISRMFASAEPTRGCLLPFCAAAGERSSGLIKLPSCRSIADSSALRRSISLESSMTCSSGFIYKTL